MIVRKAISKDTSRLHKLENNVFQKENFSLSRGSINYHIKNNLLYVAEFNEDIVAYILVLIKRKKAKIYSIGVLQKYRGQKISSILLKTVLEKILELNFKSVVLEVRVDNYGAIELYKKYGFKIQKKAESFYLDGCDAYIMEYEYVKKVDDFGCGNRI